MFGLVNLKNDIKKWKNKNKALQFVMRTYNTIEFDYASIILYKY